MRRTVLEFSHAVGEFAPGGVCQANYASVNVPPGTKLVSRIVLHCEALPCVTRYMTRTDRLVLCDTPLCYVSCDMRGANVAMLSVEELVERAEVVSPPGTVARLEYDAVLGLSLYVEQGPLQIEVPASTAHDAWLGWRRLDTGSPIVLNSGERHLLGGVRLVALQTSQSSIAVAKTVAPYDIASYDFADSLSYNDGCFWTAEQFAAAFGGAIAAGFGSALTSGALGTSGEWITTTNVNLEPQGALYSAVRQISSSQFRMRASRFQTTTWNIHSNTIGHHVGRDIELDRAEDLSGETIAIRLTTELGGHAAIDGSLHGFIELWH